MREIIRPMSALLIITLAAALCLGFVHAVTLHPIEAQQALAETEAVRDIFSDLDETKEADPSLASSAGGGTRKALYCYKAGKLAGCAVFQGCKGYGGTIELMVGFDMEGVIQGVRILSQSETPGLGANAVNPAFLNQYKSKSGGLTVTKAAPKENEIEAITSATITSTAVTQGVNAAGSFFEKYLKGAPVQ